MNKAFILALIYFASNPISAALMRRAAPPVCAVAVEYTLLNSVRSHSNLPEGIKLIELSREGLAPWADPKQPNATVYGRIDISKYNADPKSGRLLRFLSKEEMEEEKRQDAAFNVIYHMFSEKLLSEQERDFFVDRLDQLSKLPIESLRAHIARILHVMLRR
jgi:hypothetical protein